MTTSRPELPDGLPADCETPEDLLGDDGLFQQLKTALLERAPGAAASGHPGCEKGDLAGRGRCHNAAGPVVDDEGPDARGLDPAAEPCQPVSRAIEGLSSGSAWRRRKEVTY